MPNSERPPGPGLAKVREPPLFRKRRLEVVVSSVGRLQALFDGADIVSEGSTREEGGALVYYGSTSLLIALPLETPVQEPLGLALAFDPHLRLRALRVAQREASARARGPLGPLQAEIRSRIVQGAAKASLALTVDVTASVLSTSARSSRA